MDPITAQVETALADARRAAIPGAIGNALDRQDAVIVAPIAGARSRTSPSVSPLSVAIDGPGMFVLDDDGRRAYGRLGDFRTDATGRLVDGRGRALLGVAGSATRGETEKLAEIRMSSGSAYSDLAIDDRGSFSGIVDKRREVIARIPLAVFAATERMARIDDITLAATVNAGAVRFEFPGSENVGTLRSHALESGLVDLQGDLARLWRSRRQGELAAACAFASDECVRDALGLVK